MRAVRTQTVRADCTAPTPRCPLGCPRPPPCWRSSPRAHTTCCSRSAWQWSAAGWPRSTAASSDSWRRAAAVRAAVRLACRARRQARSMRMTASGWGPAAHRRRDGHLPPFRGATRWCMAARALCPAPVQGGTSRTACNPALHATAWLILPAHLPGAGAGAQGRVTAGGLTNHPDAWRVVTPRKRRCDSASLSPACASRAPGHAYLAWGATTERRAAATRCRPGGVAAGGALLLSAAQ